MKKKKKKKIRSQRSVEMEYRRIDKKISGEITSMDEDCLVGARQALAWVLKDEAMIPSKCYR